MTHGIAFGQRSVDAAFLTNFNESEGIIKIYPASYTLLRADREQANTVKTKQRESGENALFLPFKNAIEQRANKGKPPIYFTALKAATKPRESHVIVR